jgi:hypothetical protein
MKVYQQNPRELQGLMLLGIKIIENTVKEASYYIIKTNNFGEKFSCKTMIAGSQSYTFMTGTGLELLIKYYNLDYNADKIRSGFNYRLHIKDSQ